MKDERFLIMKLTNCGEIDSELLSVLMLDLIGEAIEESGSVTLEAIREVTEEEEALIRSTDG